MRTTVYVDGFNLYYGRLKGTRYKWLDLQALFSNTLGDCHQINRIRYFTATLEERSHNPRAHLRQKTYLTALKTLPVVKIHYGYFAPNTFPVPNPNPPPRLIEVTKDEEKRTDVNFAVHLLNDAYEDRFDCAVIVTNDNDMLEALKLVRKKFPQKKLGLIPTSERPTPNLQRYTRFKKIIKDSDLAAAQFPNPVKRVGKSAIYKPQSW